jgi:hypothetical protein
MKAQPKNDTALLLQQVFDFFGSNKHRDANLRGKQLRSTQSPLWYEYNLKDSFALLGKPNIRKRKAGCYIFNELVFSYGLVKDTAITRQWKKGEIDYAFTEKAESITVAIEFYVEAHPANYILDGIMVIEQYGKKYDQKAYAKELFVVNEFLLNYITKREGTDKIFLRVMLEAKGKDTYELQLVMGIFEDDCMGI